jgi:gluconolactonase
MTFDRREFLLAAGAVLPACAGLPKKSASLGFYEAFSPKFYDIVDAREALITLGDGYQWSEGPAWDKTRNQLYFTDVPGNIAYVWNQTDGVKTFLNPSGANVESGFREPGANGLHFRGNGKLLVCNHGSRSIEELDIETRERTTLAAQFRNKKFNSPNDVIENSRGDIYFTDPPYGLEGLNDSPLKELRHNGVYHLDSKGALHLLISDMTFPNGIALSPDENTLYIAQSDPTAQHIYTLDINRPNAEKTLFVDLTPYSTPQSPGLPDGMVIDIHGNIFATGPGGLFVITPKGDILGRIKTGKASANCTFGENGSTLFITNHDRLLKLKTLTRGHGWL